MVCTNNLPWGICTTAASSGVSKPIIMFGSLVRLSFCSACCSVVLPTLAPQPAQYIVGKSELLGKFMAGKSLN